MWQCHSTGSHVANQGMTLHRVSHDVKEFLLLRCLCWHHQMFPCASNSRSRGICTNARQSRAIPVCFLDATTPSTVAAIPALGCIQFAGDGNSVALVYSLI